jgi:hypothetical protein
VNISAEVNRLSSINELSKYNDNNVVREFSSYDTTGNNDDGFSGKYSFIRMNSGFPEIKEVNLLSYL